MYSDSSSRLRDVVRSAWTAQAWLKLKPSSHSIACAARAVLACCLRNSFALAIILSRLFADLLALVTLSILCMYSFFFFWIMSFTSCWCSMILVPRCHFVSPTYMCCELLQGIMYTPDWCLVGILAFILVSNTSTLFGGANLILLCRWCDWWIFVASH